MLKIFVLSKDTIIIYALVVLVLVGMFTVGTMSETVITNITPAEDVPIYRVLREDKKIALTFDVAWGDEDTDEIISLLNENDVKASFFVVGGFVDRYPESVKKIYDSGNEILNHSDTHLHMSELSKEQMVKELNGCEEKIKKITGTSMKIFRPPYGDYNEKLIKTVKEQGYVPVQWDVDSLDWKDLSVKEICSRVKSSTQEGSIILFHVGAKNTAAALKEIIPQLKEKGFQFVKVSEIIYKDNYAVDHSGQQIKC